MADDTPKRKNKPGQGRPFKMKLWVEKLKEVLDENNVAFLTDAELVFLVNTKIEDKESRITTRTLRNWKTGKTPDEETEAEFVELITEALIKQKNALFAKMEAAQNMTWTRYAWILERRWSEWNLRAISEVKHTNTQPIIQIQAADAQQAQLIDNIINAEFTVIEPIKLEAKNDNKDEDYDF